MCIFTPFPRWLLRTVEGLGLKPQLHHQTNEGLRFQFRPYTRAL